ncbi:MAG: sulfite exporter TauE/SafE family protein [Verrucomicrobiales bacterium]|nr:sulfite exporter TauE/SafE family protein [Verrucomicrobiales bacterium]
MELWTAFLLGLLGSLHCAGMCGPIALALPASSVSRRAFLLGRILNQLGRIATYLCLGLLGGVLGKTLALAGVQQGLSIGLGSLMLIAVFTTQLAPWSIGVGRWIGWVKSSLARSLKQGTPLSLAAMGALNGLLPCGLVYVACGGAVSTGSVVEGMAYMALFGLGTVPMMLSISLAGRSLPIGLRLRLQSVVPACLVLMGTLLILRGLGLGIPYLSPDLSHALTGCHSCH